VFTARYALSPYIKQTRFVFKGLNGGSPIYETVYRPQKTNSGKRNSAAPTLLSRKFISKYTDMSVYIVRKNRAFFLPFVLSNPSTNSPKQNKATAASVRRLLQYCQLPDENPPDIFRGIFGIFRCILKFLNIDPDHFSRSLYRRSAEP
jgi:hypothetical protein